jgi:hypothetical protein
VSKTRSSLKISAMFQRLEEGLPRLQDSRAELLQIESPRLLLLLPSKYLLLLLEAANQLLVVLDTLS